MATVIHSGVRAAAGGTRRCASGYFPDALAAVVCRRMGSRAPSVSEERGTDHPSASEDGKGMAPSASEVKKKAVGRTK